MSDWTGFSRVLPQTARINAAGRLEIGGCDAAELTATYGTPLFVLCERTFRDRLARYRDAFGGENVHYGAKAFLTRSIVPVIASEGVSLDVASGGELYVALAGGFPAERILMHGNNKSTEELEQAVDAGVGLIVADSRIEIERLEAVAAARGTTQRILVRITPGIEAHTHEYLKTGVEDTKFGVPIGDPALDVMRFAASCKNLDLIGIHSHIGSQIFDLEPFADAARVMVRFLADARVATSLELPILDIGGGLGIAYETDEEPPPVEAAAKVTLEAVAREAETLGTPVPTVKTEPGRWIAGPSMLTLYTVGTIKEVPGRRWYASIDGGMTDNIRPALYGARYTYLSATRPGAAHDRAFAVAGKCCESGDVLTKETLLPAVEPGELIAVAATGAYGYAMASNYNKLPRPAVVMVNDGASSILARRETYEDLMRLDGGMGE